MINAIESRALLIVRSYNMPPRVFAVRFLQHPIPGAGVLVPLLTSRQVHWTELPLAHRVFNTGFEATFLFFVTDLQPILNDVNPAFGNDLLHNRAQLEKAAILLFGAKSHHVFHSGSVIPTSVEDDDFTSRRKVREVALYVHLPLLSIGGRGQRDDTKHPRADTFSYRANRASFAGSVAPLKYDDDP